MRDVWQMTKVWAVLALVGLFAGLAGACGGGGEPQVATSATPSTAEASATPPTAEASPTPSTGAAATAAPCQALQGLQTYHYTVNLKLESPEPAASPGAGQPTPTNTITREFTGPFLFEYNIEGSFVAPDRFELSISGGGTMPFSMIFIGDQSWTQISGNWRAATQPQQIPYKPLDVCEAILAELDLSQAQPQEEKANEVKSLHYSFSQVSSPQAMARIFGPGSDMDVLIKTVDLELWLAEKDEWPVRMDIGGSGLYADGRELRVHLSLNVKDVNSKDIQVEPPL